jgi:prefoldin subunit 5|tara:strand:+ start:516 stop:674 length:159 start_codon:yes stop_codon:yes gene_type:complete
MNNRGPNDLERTIERLEKRVKELEADREILKQDIDRLSEYNQNLETMLRSKK